MSVNLYSFIGLFSRTLSTAEHLLGKGAAHAQAQGLEPESILDWRLVDDMNPLRFQLNIVCNFARQWVARVADQPVPADVAGTLDIAGYKTAFAEARAYLAAITPAQFEGRDSVALTVTLGNGMSPTLEAGQWLTGFATTNIYFHVSIAYAILRAHGVAVGKGDLFSAGL